MELTCVALTVSPAHGATAPAVTAGAEEFATVLAALAPATPSMSEPLQEPADPEGDVEPLDQITQDDADDLPVDEPLAPQFIAALPQAQIAAEMRPDGLPHTATSGLIAAQATIPSGDSAPSRVAGRPDQLPATTSAPTLESAVDWPRASPGQPPAFASPADSKPVAAQRGGHIMHSRSVPGTVADAAAWPMPENGLVGTDDVPQDARAQTKTPVASRSPATVDPAALPRDKPMDAPARRVQAAPSFPPDVVRMTDPAQAPPRTDALMPASSPQPPGPQPAVMIDWRSHGARPVAAAASNPATRPDTTPVDPFLPPAPADAQVSAPAAPDTIGPGVLNAAGPVASAPQQGALHASLHAAMNAPPAPAVIPPDTLALPPAPHVEPHRQIADAIVRTRDGAVEILLDPVELGRVTVVIGSDDRAGLGIVAERAETLELIRRHSDQLLRDLRDQGMPDARLDFLRQDAQGGRKGDGTGHGHAGDRRPPPAFGHHDDGQDAAPEPAARRARPITTSRIDIRL